MMLTIVNIMISLRCIAAAFLLVALAHGQSAELRGVVRDTTGASVSSAVVGLISPAAGTSLQARTASDGAFRFPNLAPGNYALRVTLAGFETFHATVNIRSD